jgi:hypothetical protein
MDPPALDDESVCAYCWKPADIEVEGVLTQLSCSRCPGRVTAHPECLTTHKRSRRLSISTMTGFACPRILSRAPAEVSCNGKINSTHNIVRKKPYMGLGSTPVVQAPPPKPRPPRPAKADKKSAEKPPPPPPPPKAAATKQQPQIKVLLPKPGSTVASRLGIAPASPVTKPTPKLEPAKFKQEEPRKMKPAPDYVFRNKCWTLPATTTTAKIPIPLPQHDPSSKASCVATEDEDDEDEDDYDVRIEELLALCGVTDCLTA